MENYEFFHNKTPELGTTVPDSIGGDLPGTVNIRLRDEAGPTDAFVMPAEESGLGYDAIVRHAPDGKGDVLKPPVVPPTARVPASKGSGAMLTTSGGVGTAIR